MISLLLVLLQLTAADERALNLLLPPMTNAYAIQHKQDVLVSVTYTDTVPKEVCISKHGTDDIDLSQPLEQRCNPATNVIGDVFVWENENLKFVNFRVAVYYPNGRVVEIWLTSRLNS